MPRLGLLEVEGICQLVKVVFGPEEMGDLDHKAEHSKLDKDKRPVPGS